MSDSIIIFDLDNTIVDTAVRKQKLLKKCNISGSENFDKIKKDFNLEDFVGAVGTQCNDDFFRKLDSEDSINDYVAPAFDAAKEIICWLTENSYTIYILTGRDEKLRNATLQELKKLGIRVDNSNLIMRSGGEDEALFKKRKLEEILVAKCVLAVMGDRPSEIDAALELEIPAILFTSTMTVEEISFYVSRCKKNNLIAVNNWIDAFVQMQRLARECHQLDKARSRLIEQYAAWLSDIDQKCQIIVAIAAFVSALTGKLILDLLEKDEFELLLVIAFLLSGLSMIYAIRSFTARRSSGSLASKKIKPKLKQLFGVIFDRPKSWVNVENDPEDEFRKLRNSSFHKKSQAHMSYFKKRYGTTDIDALENLRLYELRAMNYSKVYPERIASRLLMLSLGAMIVWVLSKFTGDVFFTSFYWLKYMVCF